MPAYSLFGRHFAKRQNLRWFRLFHFASKEMGGGRNQTDTPIGTGF